MEEAEKGKEMTTDKTGRKLKVGHIIDVFLFGMFNAKLLGIKERPLQVSPTQAIPPHIVVMCSLTPFIGQGGMVPDVYILQEPDPKDPIVINAEKEEASGPRLIRP